MKKKQKVFLISLGCPRNLVDSEILAASSIMDGNYEITFDPYEADHIVINTCG
ncbi:30S ribosomal protein S12 methylthiotransferase RimO, partial [Candidatus Calescamantes bacterium]|nr:30S ribosomal protein S12 methylthiotransferase RimO [Candidatus Calescamantes bacterium]